MLDGDLLEVEARYFIEAGEVCADFQVWWRHPETGVGGVYYGPSTGFGSHRGFDESLLATLAEDVVADAAYDFRVDGARFARDLRSAPIRDTTEPATRAALDAGPPYPQRSGRPAPEAIADDVPPHGRRAANTGEGMAPEIAEQGRQARRGSDSRSRHRR